ncbi:MAG TPA: hypothetical protein VI702_00085, partial [Nitrospiria bacterium]
DLRRLVTAYRCYLRASAQAPRPGETLGTADLDWRGGFGRAVQILFRDWPSPNQSRKFENGMLRRMRNTGNSDRAFIEAFNDYLGQKRLSPEELSEVIARGREAHEG